MNNLALSLSEVSLISRLKYYKWNGLLRDGKLLLENNINKQKVTGKIISSTSEGELCIRLQLQHENINRLLEVLCINDRIKLLISPFIGNCIGILIHDDSFNNHPRCFERKKSYAKGILSAVSYMHENSIFHLNLSDENIAVCTFTDKAIICDFSYTTTQERVTKQLLPPNRHYPTPEVKNGGDNETFDCLPIDIWDCGILLLQIFTQHQLPWGGEVNDSLEILEDSEILKKTNPGANLKDEIASEFRVFIQRLLTQNPDRRPSAKKALHSSFLHTLHIQHNEKARRFRMSGITSDSFTQNDPFIDTLSENDIDIANLTESRCFKSDKPHSTFTKSEPDNTLHRKIPYSSLSLYSSCLNSNLSDSDVVNLTNLKYPKSGKSCLVWTKSEPNSILHQEIPNTSLSRHASHLTDSLSSSEIDVVNLTDQDDVVNLTDQDDVVNRIHVKYPKVEKSRLAWKKSEPRSTVHQEVPHQSLTECVRSLLLSKNNDVESADYKENIKYNNYLSEWDVDNSLIKNELKNSLEYHEASNDKKEELSKYPSCSIEKIIPYILSMTDEKFSNPLPNSYISSTEGVEEFYPQSESNNSKIGIDEWFDVPLENSHEPPPIQSKRNRSNKKMRKKNFSIKDSLDLISIKSLSKDWKISESPILIDKSNLYEKSETGIAKGRQKIVMLNRLSENPFCPEAIAIRQRKKWYRKLLCCGRI